MEVVETEDIRFFQKNNVIVKMKMDIKLRPKNTE